MGYTKKQAAQELGVSISTIERWVREGKLRPTYRPTKFGQQAEYSKAEVLALKKARELLKGK